MALMQNIFSRYEERCSAATKIHNPYANGITWIEGELVPLEEARIPIMDQGFMKGDLTYDVAGIWDGRFFRLDDHLIRFYASAKKLRLTIPVEMGELRALLIEMANKSKLRDCYVQMIVTRGLKPLRGNDARSLTSKMYLLILPYIWVMPPSTQLTGGTAVITRTVRRIPPGAIDPTVKNLQWGDFTRGMLEAQDRDATYPFLSDGDGSLTEGAGFNIFLVKDGILYTPSRGVLEGVTRKSVFDIARAGGIEVKMDFIPVEMAYEADEIFMCTTAGGIMPITQLDGSPIHGGKIGTLTAKIWTAYWDLHYNPAYSFALTY